MNEYREKLLSIGAISNRSRPIVTEGKAHPETGKSWKRTEDEGSIITEHNTKDDRVDATAKAKPIHLNLEAAREQIRKVKNGKR